MAEAVPMPELGPTPTPAPGASLADPPPVPTGGLQVLWHTRAADCDAALWVAGFPAPLEGRWWYEALEQGGLEDQFRFLYAEVHDRHGRPLAIAPCFLMDVPLEQFVPPALVPLVRPLGKIYPALLHQRTLFVGSPCSDHGWIGVRPGQDAADLDAIVATLHAAVIRQAQLLRAPMRIWKDFPAQFQPALDRLTPQARLFRVPSFPGSEVDLPNGGEEAYFLAMRGSRRQKLRRTLRRSHAAVKLDVEVLAQPTPARLASLFSLFWQTYEQASTRFERLTPAFFNALAAAPGVRMIVLSEANGGPVVAFMLVYVDGLIMVNKFIGIDYGRPREWLLYFRLWEAALHTAIAFGLGGIQSGQTGYSGKIATGHRLIPLWNWCHHANPLLRTIYAWVGARITWATLDRELATLESDSGTRQEPAPE